MTGRRSPGSKSRAASTPTSATAESNAHHDIDRALIGDESIWARLFAGEFRLGVKCSRCGRFVYSAASKRRRMGGRCASKAAEK